MIAVVIGLAALPPIAMALAADVWRERRRARRECQQWFDENVRPAGKIDQAGDVLQ